MGDLRCMRLITTLSLLKYLHKCADKSEYMCRCNNALSGSTYRVRGNFRGMKFSLNRKQTGFSLLYFRGSQVHHGKVACYVLLQISNCCKLANFHGLNFAVSVGDREIREIYIPRKFPRIRYPKQLENCDKMCISSPIPC